MALLRGILILLSIIGLAIAGLAFAFADRDIPATELDAKYGQPPSQFIELPSGARVHYRDQGKRDGLPVVLLHGSNASLHTWEPWVRLLGDQFRIVTVDLPAHGLTGPVPNRDYSQEGMAKFVDEFTRAIKLPRFALGGNAMGGTVAARFAIEHPERLTHLILIGTAGMPTKTPLDEGLGLRLARIPVLQNILLFVTPRRLFEDGLKKSMVDHALVTPEMIDRYWELSRREGSRAALIERYQNVPDDFIEKNVTKLVTPTLIMWGDQDTLVPRDAGDAYNAVLKGSTLVVYKNVGHQPMEEVPEQSARALRRFLSPPPAEPPAPAPAPTPASAPVVAPPAR